MKFDRFVVEMEIHQSFAPSCPLMEVGIERQAGKFAFEVDFVFGAVGWMVKNSVGVIENIFFCDCRVVIVIMELS